MRDGYQSQVRKWVVTTFGEESATSVRERVLRFLEEAVELAQALRLTEEQAIGLVRYVYKRKRGEPRQEVGGTMITLAALCTAVGIDLQLEAERELVRIQQPGVIARCRRRQEEKLKRPFEQDL